MNRIPPITMAPTPDPDRDVDRLVVFHRQLQRTDLGRMGFLRVAETAVHEAQNAGHDQRDRGHLDRSHVITSRRPPHFIPAPSSEQRKYRTTGVAWVRPRPSCAGEGSAGISPGVPGNSPLRSCRPDGRERRGPLCDRSGRPRKPSGRAHRVTAFRLQGIVQDAVLERSPVMLYTVAVVLLVLWGLGLVSGYTLGAFVHVLLVVAIVLFLVSMISGRRGFA